MTFIHEKNTLAFLCHFSFWSTWIKQGPNFPKHCKQQRKKIHETRIFKHWISGSSGHFSLRNTHTPTHTPVFPVVQTQHTHTHTPLFPMVQRQNEHTHTHPCSLWCREECTRAHPPPAPRCAPHGAETEPGWPGHMHWRRLATPGKAHTGKEGTAPGSLRAKRSLCFHLSEEKSPNPQGTQNGTASAGATKS